MNRQKALLEVAEQISRKESLLGHELGDKAKSRLAFIGVAALVEEKDLTTAEKEHNKLHGRQVLRYPEPPPSAAELAQAERDRTLKARLLAEKREEEAAAEKAAERDRIKAEVRAEMEAEEPKVTIIKEEVTLVDNNDPYSDPVNMAKLDQVAAKIEQENIPKKRGRPKNLVDPTMPKQ